MRIEKELTKVIITKEDEEAFNKTAQLIFSLCREIGSRYGTCYDCPFSGVCAACTGEEDSIELNLQNLIDTDENVIIQMSKE